MKKISFFSVFILINILNIFGESFYSVNYVYLPLERIDNYTKLVMGNLTCWSKEYKIVNGFSFRYDRVYGSFKDFDFSFDVGTSYFLKNINCYNYMNININVDLFSLDGGFSFYRYLTQKEKDFILRIALVNLINVNRVNYNTSNNLSVDNYFWGYKFILSFQMSFISVNEHQILLDFGIYNFFSSSFQFSKFEINSNKIQSSGLYIGIVFINTVSNVKQ